MSKFLDDDYINLTPIEPLQKNKHEKIVDDLYFSLDKFQYEYSQYEKEFFNMEYYRFITEVMEKIDSLRKKYE